MNAIIDEDVHRSLKIVLQELGFTVFDIRDHGFRGKSDTAIFSFAQKKKAVLFTADLGFGNILRYPLTTHCGICLLRFPNELSTNQINQEVKHLLLKITLSDFPGNLVVVSPGRIRIHRDTIHN